MFCNNGTGAGAVFWALVHVPEGNSLNTLATASGSSLYKPERNVLCYGSYCQHSTTNAYHTPQHVKGSTKTMRKLQGGDTIQLAIKSDTANVLTKIVGALHFFYKE